MLKSIRARALRNRFTELNLPGAAWTAAIFFLLAFASVPARAKGPESVADVAGPLQEAVVNISTSQKVKESQAVPPPDAPKGSPFEEFFDDFFNRQDQGGVQRVNSLGSGFVIDSAGLIVTNNHVIEGADEIVINFNDGSKLTVTEVVGKDSKTDLALLRVKPKKPLTAVNFGDSGKLRVGDWVMAIGNPFGLGGSLTVGVISATRRDINAGPYDEFLQTDAAINRGNSGGPLFNMNGEVIGINTAIISPTGGSIGIGFAVPSNTALHVIDQIKKYGETRRGWLGVRIQTVNDEFAESLGMSEAKGALVANVTPNGPAAAAGVELGDVILNFDGQEVTALRQLPRLVAQAEIGREVEVVVLRNGQKRNLKVTVGRLEEGPEPQPKPSEADQQKRQPMLGLAVSALTDALRAKYKISKKLQGVVITAVEPDSPAGEKNIEPGAVIVEVTHEKVRTPEDVLARFTELKSLNRKTVLLLVANPDGDMKFVALPLADQ
jgi:serine protease Do